MVVVELDEFEERFLPAPPTLHPRTQSLVTGIVSHLQTSLSATSESRLKRKENIGTILVSLPLCDVDGLVYEPVVPAFSHQQLQPRRRSP